MSPDPFDDDSNDDDFPKVKRDDVPEDAMYDAEAVARRLATSVESLERRERELATSVESLERRERELATSVESLERRELELAECVESLRVKIFTRASLLSGVAGVLFISAVRMVAMHVFYIVCSDKLV